LVNELLVKAEIALLNLQKLAASLSEDTSRPSQVPLRSIFIPPASLSHSNV
jgi:hypothetical protein